MKRYRLFCCVLITMVLAMMPTASVSALMVTSITPASGSNSGNNLVTIKGSGFMRTKNEVFTDVAAGVEHALMLSDTGHVWAVGDNRYGQLGVGQTTTTAITPVDVTDNLNLDSDDFVTDIICGDYYSMVITNNHRVLTWGLNEDGQLGNDSWVDSYKPVDITANFQLDAGNYVAGIAAGRAANYATTSNGDVYFWGDTSNKQSGEIAERYTPQTTPELIAHLGDNIRRIAAGYESAISLTVDHKVSTWGRNTSGELGYSKYGEQNNTDSPHGVLGIDDNFDLVEGDEVVDVEAGNGVMAALTKDYRVYIWGNDQTGMLGLNGERPNLADPVTGNDLSAIPIDITDNFDLANDDCIAQISIGNSHVLALSQYGEVFSWGEGDYGQLGNLDMNSTGDVTNITDNFDLDDDVYITKVVAAGAFDPLQASYSYALDSQGNVYAWGGSAKGKPGINSITNNPIPTVISSRLSVDVPNVATINFGDNPVLEFDVVGDETVQLLTPSALEVGEVSVTITDSEGTSVEAIQKYTYTQATTDLAPDSDDDSADSAGDANDDDSSDNTTGDKDDKDQQDDNADADNNKNADKSDSSDDDATSGGNIAAPNTGAAFGRQPFNHWSWLMGGIN